MPPKKGKGKATILQTDSDYEEAAAEPGKWFRLALGYKNGSFSKAKNADPIGAPVGAYQMPQDPIYSRVSTDPNAGFPDTNAPSTNQNLCTNTTLLGSL